MTKARKPATLAERLVRARDLSNEINAATDDLNIELTELQKKLSALRLGVEACVSLTTTDEEDAHHFYRVLWFEKVNADWIFTIRTGQDFDEAPAHMNPLLKASKALRLESAHRMPDLLEALIQKAEKQVEEVEEATEVVKNVGKMVDEANGIQKAAGPGNRAVQAVVGSLSVRDRDGTLLEQVKDGASSKNLLDMSPSDVALATKVARKFVLKSSVAAALNLAKPTKDGGK